MKTSAATLRHSSGSRSSRDGSRSADQGPRWLLFELTHRCPLKCLHCSNPLDLVDPSDEIDTADWIKVLREARELGAVQLGLSGGEPLAKPGLEEIVREARQLGYYVNLITSGIGLTENRLKGLKEAGLDHVQLSLQAADEVTNDEIAGARVFSRKLRAAAAIKNLGYPMVLNVVLHRYNIHQVPEIIGMAEALGADYLELANAQYEGWGFLNSAHLLPSEGQVREAEIKVREWRERTRSSLKAFFVVPDYFEERPKPCSGGWGSILLVITPDGRALPCHGARQIPGFDFPSVREHSLEWIWHDSPAFNRFRGDGWMREPCRTCQDRSKDFGGCRCQAYALTGDPANPDPVCAKSPSHHLIVAMREEVQHRRGPGKGLARTMARTKPLSQSGMLGSTTLASCESESCQPR